MIRRVEQSRTGENGTCFRACLASLLGLTEAQVPDFPEANQDAGVNPFLARYGLRYVEVPYTREDPPVGEHVILGTSPRGGQHTVVGENGRCVMDPHPQDGTGRGLVSASGYGLLVPMGRAKDAAPLRGEALSSEVRKLRAKHDEVWHQPTRAVVGGRAAYAAALGPVTELLREAEALLRSTRISDKTKWMRKLEVGKDLVARAKADAAKDDYEPAVYRIDAALSAAHYVIDALRSLAYRTGAKDAVTLHPDKEYALRYTAKDRARLHRALDHVLKVKGAR